MKHYILHLLFAVTAPLALLNVHFQAVWASEATADFTAIHIAELVTGTSDSASAEFIELYNASFANISLEGVSIEYKSASGSTWREKATLDGEIIARGRYLIASSKAVQYGVQNSDAALSSGLAAGGGAVRLVYDESVLRELHWLSTVQALDQSSQSLWPAPNSSQSLKSVFDEDGEITTGYALSESPSPSSDSAWLADDLAQNSDDIDSGDNNNDNVSDDGNDVDDSAQDESNQGENTESNNEDGQGAVGENDGGSGEEGETSDAGIDGVGGPEDQDVGVVQSDDSATQNTSQANLGAGLVLSELFVDPISPETDAEAEFVEIHNTSDEAVDLAGLVLQTGSTFRYSFTLPSHQLAPGEYIAVFSKDSGLTLANGGGAARLLSSDEATVVSETVYEKAKAGQSWAWNGTAWVWTETPTPHAANQFASENVEDSGAVSGATYDAGGNDTGSSSEASLAGSLATTSVVSNEATVSGKEEDGSSSSGSFSDESQQPTPVNRTLLALLVLGAILYWVYEYRTDIAYRGRQLRSYVAAR